MHYHMQNEQYKKVVEVCELYGDQEPSLWEQALGYFAHKEEDCKEYVAAVLKHIEAKNLMPPLLGERNRGKGAGPLIRGHVGLLCPAPQAVLVLLSRPGNEGFCVGGAGTKEQAVGNTAAVI